MMFICAPAIKWFLDWVVNDTEGVFFCNVLQFLMEKTRSVFSSNY